MLKKVSPHQGEGKADDGIQTGDRNPGTPKGEGNVGMIPGWEILKSVLLRDSRNGLNNLSRLDMLCNFRQLWVGVNALTLTVICTLCNSLPVAQVRYIWKPCLEERG